MEHQESMHHLLLLLNRIIPHRVLQVNPERVRMVQLNNHLYRNHHQNRQMESL